VKKVNYLISAITNDKSATNSASARAIIPGTNILLAASGFLAIPATHALPIKPIPIAAQSHHTPIAK
jgi:hypothetical protein